MSCRPSLPALVLLGLWAAGPASAQAPLAALPQAAPAAPAQAAPLPPQALPPGLGAAQPAPAAPDLGGMHRQMVERRRAQEQMGVYNNLMALGLRRRDR